MDMLKILQKDQKVWDLFTYKEEYFSSLHDEYVNFPII